MVPSPSPKYGPLVPVPMSDLRHFKEVSHLSVGQLDEQISQKSSACLADAGVA